MAVNGIRVSALPLMSVTELSESEEDYLIVNDQNLNTKRILFKDFVSVVNGDSIANNVSSVNGNTGAVIITAADLGAATVVELAAVEVKADNAVSVTSANTASIVQLRTDVDANTVAVGNAINGNQLGTTSTLR